ncbi:uncharacterized protein LOC111281549 [Durio zibethinus]|uniref:ATP-dependent DNA helicase n=1 Tax=Durio zibethinus TaxID=66656 RepID=A0A6P5X9E9_DURZI|nr:uncharacterized protein LOC111281549 [Durio zibethinus]
MDLALNREAMDRTSYEKLRIVNGIMYLTFQLACYAVELLGNDNEWQDALVQASQLASASEIRGYVFYQWTRRNKKLFLRQTFTAKLRSIGQIILVITSSGIASLLLPGGQTAHSRTKTLMMHRNYFEALDKTLRDINSNNDPYARSKCFNEKIVILDGNFKQVLLLMKGRTRKDIVNASIRITNHELKLKIGYVIMLLKNINQTLGLCNGTRLIITQLALSVIEGGNNFLSNCHM